MSINDLHPKQRAMIPMLAEGKTTKEIANVMGIPQDTVTTYRVRMYRLCNVNNSAHLVNWAYQNGILKVIQ